jgi:soluble lytic murein transglycosylase-like protein
LSVATGLAVLAPGPLAVSMAEPVPVLRAAPTVDAVSETAVVDDRARLDNKVVDQIAVVSDALGDCTASLSRAERQIMARIIHRESHEHGYDPLFVTALVQVESGCSRTARGGDALGLVQLLPSTARDVARRAGVRWHGDATLTEPAASIEIGLRYLVELEEQFHDSYRAVAAYNLGPARVARMSSGRAQRTEYVRKILSRYEQLRDSYT